MQLYEYDTLKQWLSNPNRVIDKKENLRIFSQMVSGLKHVHEHGLLHRDLKPANIFMSKDGIVKIGDFGLSRDLDNPTPIVASDLASIIKKPNLKICTAVDDNLASSGNKTSSVGTPGYVAPEILNSDCYGPKVDVYSLGIMLMEL
jgi:serine/threonine protein kinase